MSGLVLSDYRRLVIKVGSSLLVDAGCEIRGDEQVVALISAAIPATEEDWRTGYLDSIASIRIVSDIDTAIAHIAKYRSGHTDSIITSDTPAARCGPSSLQVTSTSYAGTVMFGPDA